MARKSKKSCKSRVEEGCGCFLGCLVCLFIVVGLANRHPELWIVIGVIALIYASGAMLFALLPNFLNLSNKEKQSQDERYWRSLVASQISNGLDFEQFIAQKLRDNGMIATVTPASGDQGVDILATTSRGTRLAIQVKLHSKSVTNKAIQEGFAGRIFHKCSLAVVVTNQSFTQSAEQLALATGVILVGFAQLGELENGTHWLYGR